MLAILLSGLVSAQEFSFGCGEVDEFNLIVTPTVDGNTVYITWTHDVDYVQSATHFRDDRYRAYGGRRTVSPDRWRNVPSGLFRLRYRACKNDGTCSDPVDISILVD